MDSYSNDYYMKKYLKYKNKYLELKGGKLCPRVGFHQHITECWHDALSTIILYSDNISDNIQHALENYRKDFQTVEELVEDILTFSQRNENLQFLLPLNIDERVYDKFQRYCREWLINLFKRFLNEQLKLEKEVQQIKGPRKSRLVRQISFKESLLCASNIYNVLNLNNNQPLEFKIKS
jgi:hypothetical protein